MSKDTSEKSPLEDLNPLREAILEAAEEEALRAGPGLPTAPLAPAEASPAAHQPRQRKAHKATGSLVSRLSTASPYDVMLCVGLMAILLAILCLVIELTRYGWSIQAV